MSGSAMQEILDIPQDFIIDGKNFLNRCTKPDRREFIKISQAVGMGFMVMGAIGYVVKLSMCQLIPGGYSNRVENVLKALR